MNKSIRWLCILCMIILPSIIFAQGWVARYDGPGNVDDAARAIAVDDLGNVYVTGYSRGSVTSYDYATVKYNSSGIEQWVARYNGPGHLYQVALDQATAIAVDDQGNVYVTGRSGYYDLSGGTSDYATVKYDSSGIEQWVASYNGPGNGNDAATAIAVDDLSNVYVTGSSGYVWEANKDYATVKYNASGNRQWVARYNGPASSIDSATALAIDDLGNVYITGLSRGAGGGGGDYATVKYDSSGIEQWVARYNGPDSSRDEAYAIAVDDQGNVYVTGRCWGSGTDDDYATVKYDAAGVEQWVEKYDGPGNGADVATAIAIDDLGNIYVTGRSVGSGGTSDYATVKYDVAGVEQWVEMYDGTGNGADAATAIAIDDPGNVYVTGQSWGSGTDYDYATVKYDVAGVEQWVEMYDGTGNGADVATAIAVDDLGNIYVTGRSWGLGTDYDYATIKYSPTGVEEDELTMKKGNELTATIFHGSLQLPEGKICKVFDITGRIVEPDKIQPGIYFIEIDGVVTQKVIKIR